MNPLSRDAKRAARPARIQKFVENTRHVGREKGRAVPTLGEFAEDLLQEFGGSRNLCRSIVAEYHAAAKGSQTRQRLMESITRIISTASKLAGPDLPDGDELSDEDIDREFSEGLEELRIAMEAEEDEQTAIAEGEAAEEAKAEPPPEANGGASAA